MNKQITTVPALRFPEFVNAGEWEEKKLRDIANISTGSSNKENSTASGGQYTFFDRSKDIRTSNIFLFDEEAVIVAGEGQTFSPKYFVGKFDLHQRTYAIMNFKNSLGKFIYYFIHQNKNYFLSQAVGSTVKSLRLPMFIEFKINLPKKQEQQKIADCLSTLDELIAAHTDKLQALKDHKKGLMQNLFPAEGKTTPNYRFPEFVNAGAWDTIELGNLSKTARSGGTPTSTNKKYYDGNIPFLSISDITKQGKYLTHTSKTVSQEGIDNSSSWVVPINTIIYSMYASVGLVSINKIPLATSQAVINITLKDGINIDFVYYYLLDYKKHINKHIEIGTQGNINAEIVKSLNINLPEPEEQQKIANCLTALDDLITTQNEKITQLQQHKKGLMQNLFPTGK